MKMYNGISTENDNDDDEKSDQISHVSPDDRQ